MTTNIAKIRTFVDLMRNHAIAVAYGRQLYAADSALAELEKAAADPVATLVGFDVETGLPADIAWHADCAAFNSGDKLYTVPPPAPVAEIREVVVTDEMCDSAYLRKWESQTSLSGAEPDDEDRQWAREWLAAWRAELGPTLGMVELKEPTPEECERISMAYYDDEALVDRDHRHLGKDMFDACRAVLWPKEGGK